MATAALHNSFGILRASQAIQFSDKEGGMIAHITGSLAEAWSQNCIVLTRGGLGYLLSLPAHTFAGLPAIGEDVAFYTSLAVREDARELFGFDTFAERQTFEILRGINKIGPRTALAILSEYRPGELENIVREENQLALTKVSGIGPKTAQHVLLELRYKLGPINRIKMADRPGMPPAQTDVRAALANLGYDESECGSIVRGLFEKEPDLDVGSAIRLALKELAKGKS